MALHDLVADVMDLVATEARLANIALSWGEARRVLVLADRHALAKAVMGALLSSFQAAGESGVVRIGIPLAAEL